MSLVSKETGGGGGFDPIPEGTYVARCISVVDFGLQPRGNWPAKEQIYIGFEVPSERVEWTDRDGNEHEGSALIGMRYTNSLSEKAHLRAHLQSWRGRAFTAEELAGFDVRKVLGVPCMISVVHNHKNGNTYANITAVMKLPKGTECPDAENELLSYSDEDGDAETFGKLPPWMQRAIEAGRALKATEDAPPPESETPAPGSPASQEPPFDDDIPF